MGKFVLHIFLICGFFGNVHAGIPRRPMNVVGGLSNDAQGVKALQELEFSGWVRHKNLMRKNGTVQPVVLHRHEVADRFTAVINPDNPKDMGILEKVVGRYSQNLLHLRRGSTDAIEILSPKILVSTLDPLGDLTIGELKRIQNFSDRIKETFFVVGSAAMGRRRNVGSRLPVGKGPGTRSDIDYFVRHSTSSQERWRLDELFIKHAPDVYQDHLMEGVFNGFFPDINQNPAIIFSPETHPAIITLFIP